MDALAAIVEEDERQQGWQTYVADVGCMLVKLWSKKSKLPFYSETVKPKTAKTDSRSKQEIVDDMVSRRRKRRRMEVIPSETV